MITAVAARSGNASNGVLVKKLIGLIVVIVVCVAVVVIVLKVFKTFDDSSSDSKKEKTHVGVRVLTNQGGVGNFGPSILKYEGILKYEVKVSPQHPGIQLWTIPVSGLWSIEARGASGADGILAGSSGNRKRGGYGAIVKGKFQLHKGRILKILVGNEGSRDYLVPHRPGGGGGGTFVVYEDGKPLLVAGGGGGGGIPKASRQTDGEGGRSNDEPSSDVSGSEGDGGKLLDTSDGSETVIDKSAGHHKVIAGAGGGMYSAGVGFKEGWGGESFVGGGNGGEAKTLYDEFPHGKRGRGGFGGGGAAGLLPGGGGGYSGGGVKGCWLKCDGKNGGTAEGGSSYNSGISPSNKANKNKGPGRVYIRLMAEEVEED